MKLRICVICGADPSAGIYMVHGCPGYYLGIGLITYCLVKLILEELSSDPDKIELQLMLLSKKAESIPPVTSHRPLGDEFHYDILCRNADVSRKPDSYASKDAFAAAISALNPADKDESSDRSILIFASDDTRILANVTRDDISSIVNERTAPTLSLFFLNDNIEHDELFKLTPFSVGRHDMRTYCNGTLFDNIENFRHASRSDNLPETAIRESINSKKGLVYEIYGLIKDAANEFKSHDSSSDSDRE